MSTVFILVDALRHDYLKVHGSAPYLDSCSAKGVHIQKIVPSRGFCERVEILTGVGFPENGFLTAIGRSTNTKNSYGLLRSLPRSVLGNYTTRRIVCRLAHRKRVQLQPYNIPLDVLPDLCLTEDATDHTKPHAFAMESMVDVLANANRSIFWQFAALGMHNGSDDDRVEATIAEMECSNHDLYMLYLGALDETGHKYGPEAPEVGFALEKIDKTIQKVFEALQQQDQEATLVVIGDHGMGQINRIADAGSWIFETAKDLKLQVGRDFTYFLDSTMCRIWGNTERFNQVKSEFLKGLDAAWEGSGLRLDLPMDTSLYGEYIWACDPGVLVFPDFFHQKGDPYKGMHGYDPSDDAMGGMGIVFGKNVANVKSLSEGSLGDVAATLCALQDLAPPTNARGKSWL